MITAVIIITIAFIWLLWETRLFSVDLMGRGLLDIGEILMLGLGMIFMAIGLTVSPFKAFCIYGKYYRLFKDPVLHRVLKLERRSRYISPGLIELADCRVRMFERLESEIETVIEQ